MQTRRILIVTNRVPYPLNDGGNHAMHAMIYGYMQAGWEVCLLAMNTSRHYIVPQKLKELYTDIDAFETMEIDNEVTILSLITNLLFSKLPNHVERFHHSSFTKKLKDVIAKIEPDVVQVESVYLSSYLKDIRSAGNAYTILRMHNIEHQVWKRVADNEKNPIKKWYLNILAKRIKKYEERVWAEYDMLLAITPQDEQIALPYNKNIVTVPFGIEVHQLHGATEEKWNLYHIGAMDWLPNADGITWFLQDIWPAIHERYRTIEFYFAGRNMPQQLILAEVDGARCMGEVPDAGAFIADKKILVVPLRSAGGIRVKILEAMAARKVVISTDVGMQGIDAQPDVHYIRANTPEEFLQAVDKCMKNTSWAENIGYNAATLVKYKYDNTIIMQQLTHTIEEKAGA